MPRGRGGVRDPRSVDWDDYVRPILIRAIRASRQRKSVVIWIASPRAQFRDKDQGGRTAEERAFTRSAYWQVFGLPHKYGAEMDWSLRLAWGDRLYDTGYGRRARACQVRVWPRGQARQTGPSWVDEVESTGDTSFQRPRRFTPPERPGKIAS
jgi:hypothetical protein